MTEFMKKNGDTNAQQHGELLTELRRLKKSNEEVAETNRSVAEALRLVQAELHEGADSASSKGDTGRKRSYEELVKAFEDYAEFHGNVHLLSLCFNFIAWHFNYSALGNVHLLSLCFIASHFNYSALSFNERKLKISACIIGISMYLTTMLTGTSNYFLPMQANLQSRFSVILLQEWQDNPSYKGPFPPTIGDLIKNDKIKVVT